MTRSRRLPVRPRLTVEALGDRSVPAVNAILSGNLLIAWDFSGANVALDVTIESGQMKVFDTSGGNRTEMPIGGGPVTPGMIDWVIVSTGAGNDRITISPAVPRPASVNSGDGRDTLIGGSGNDILNSGPDGIGDVITGGAGDDILSGGAGNDTLTGGAGNDIITGAAGEDILIEAGDFDFTLLDLRLETRIAAGAPAGADSLSGIERARLTGGAGANRLDASAFSGPVILDGGAGGDTVVGGAGADLITGGPGRDFLTGGPGDDSLDGGPGIDRLVESGDADFTLVQGTLRRDGRMTGRGADVLVRNRVEQAELTGGAGDNRIDAAAFQGRVWLRGGDGNDTLRGGRSADVLVGGGGNDDADGGAGRDLLIGGTGTDRLAGQAGSDLLVGGATAHDDAPAALDAILAEWTSARGYGVRIRHLMGTLAGGHNGSILLNATTAPDDGAADGLTGGLGLDWFVAGPTDPSDRLGIEQALTV